MNIFCNFKFLFCGFSFVEFLFIDWSTITVHSLIEVIKFLLAEGMECVLSERFCQDLLKENFGHQRARGGYGDNPTVQSFGYNDLSIATQRCIAPVVRGNVAGRHKGKSLKVICDSAK